MPTGIRTLTESSTNSSANHYTIGTMTTLSKTIRVTTSLYQKNAHKSRVENIYFYLQTTPVGGLMSSLFEPVLSIQKLYLISFVSFE